jgi:hypothetical protein
MNALLKYTVCILLLLLGQQSVHASIGSVATISGTPGEIARGKQKLPGTVGATVESDDIVTTKAGVANITFVDDTKVKVSENSRLLLDEFIFDPKKSDAGKLAMKVGLGAVRYASGQIAKTNPQQVAVKTPTATVSVRGTDFALVVDEAGRSLIVLLPSCRPDQRPKQYELDENRCAVGKIAVSTLAGEVVMDRAFQATYVASSTSKPSKPVILNITESAVSGDMIVTMPVEVVQAALLSGNRKNSIRSGNGGAAHDKNQDTNSKTDTAQNGTANTTNTTNNTATNTTNNTATNTTNNTSNIINSAVSSDVTSANNAALAIASNSDGTQNIYSNNIERGSAISELSAITNINSSSSKTVTINNSTNNTSIVAPIVALDSSYESNTILNSAVMSLTIDDMHDDDVGNIANQYVTVLRRNMELQRRVTGAVTSLDSALVEGITTSTVIVTPQQLLQMLSSLGTNILGVGSTTLAQGSSSTVVTSSALAQINSGSATLGANAVSTLPGASYTQSAPNSTSITVANISQLISTCDTITRICITLDGQQQYSSSDGVLNNGTNPTNYGSNLVVSRLAETYEHYAQVKLPTATANSLITLIQNDVVVALAIGNFAGANIVTINQRWGNR